MSTKAKPWEQPGYTFTTGWPIGYTPTAAQSIVDDKRAKASAKQAAGQTQRRMEAAEQGIAWGVGTIPGLSKKAMPSDPAKAGRIRKASGV